MVKYLKTEFFSSALDFIKGSLNWKAMGGTVRPTANTTHTPAIPEGKDVLPSVSAGTR